MCKYRKGCQAPKVSGITSFVRSNSVSVANPEDVVTWPIEGISGLEFRARTSLPTKGRGHGNRENGSSRLLLQKHSGMSTITRTTAAKYAQTASLR